MVGPRCVTKKVKPAAANSHHPMVLPPASRREPTHQNPCGIAHPTSQAARQNAKRPELESYQQERLCAQQIRTGSAVETSARCVVEANLGTTHPHVTGCGANAHACCRFCCRFERRVMRQMRVLRLRKARLYRENSGGHARNRTGVYGFAIRCVTTPPRGLNACRPAMERQAATQSVPWGLVSTAFA